MKTVRVFAGIVLLLLAAVPVFSQDILRLDVEIEIRGEAAAPTAIIAVSRNEPDYVPATLEKDFTDELIPLDEVLFRPAESELQPKKIEDIRELLAKERY